MLPNDPATIGDLEIIIKNLLNVLIPLAGIAVFVMFLLGGLQYLTAGGNPEKTKAAVGTITHAIFGLVLIILAWFILFFLETLTGVKVTEFRLRP